MGGIAPQHHDEFDFVIFALTLSHAGLDTNYIKLFYTHSHAAFIIYWLKENKRKRLVVWFKTDIRCVQGHLHLRKIQTTQ